MNTNRQRLFNQLAASRTDLGCSRRIDFNELSTGTFSLVPEHFLEEVPSGVTDAFAEPFVLDHAFNVQFFYCNKIKFFDYFRGFLVTEIKPFVLYFLVMFSQKSDGFSPPVTASFLSGNRPLEPSQLSLRFSVQARIINFVARVVGIKVSEPYVQADRLIDRGKEFGRHLNIKAGVPFTKFLGDAESLYFSWNTAMPLDLHEADILQVEPFIFDATTIPIGAVEECRKLLSRLESWESRFLSASEPFEKCLVGFIYPSDCLLGRAAIAFSNTPILSKDRQIINCLVIIRQRGLAFLPDILPVSQTLIIYIPVPFKLLVELLSLFLVRIKPVFIGSNHLFACLTFNSYYIL